MAHELDIIPATEWGFFTLPRPMCIAGPCSAETEEQVMETAKGLDAFGIHVFRAGIWKPRTHPGSFEGVGAPGLKWLKRVQKELGMKVCTEVASEKHVLQCIKYGVDMLWIGARTSANPFLMQEIADALEGTDIPVLVKNPVNPTCQAGIHDSEVLIGQGEVHTQLWFEGVEQVLQLLNIVSIHLCRADVHLLANTLFVDSINDSVTLGLSATCYHEVGKDIVILCNLVGCNSGYATCTNHQYS